MSATRAESNVARHSTRLLLSPRARAPQNLTILWGPEGNLDCACRGKFFIVFSGMRTTMITNNNPGGE